jgi:hypothetical protein
MNNNKANEMVKSGEYIYRVFKCDTLPESEIHILENTKTGKYLFPTSDGTDVVNELYTCLTAAGKYIYTANKDNVGNSNIRKFFRDIGDIIFPELKENAAELIDELAKKYKIPQNIVNDIKRILGL